MNEEKSLSKIVINVLGERFWIKPSIMTFSKRKWTSRPYKNFKKLLVTEDLWDQNLVLSINGDKEHKFLHLMLQYKQHPFPFKKDNITEIEKYGFTEIKIPHSKIILRIDKKGYSLLKRGNIPFCDLKYLQSFQKHRNNKQYVFIIWRGIGFIALSEKLKIRQNIAKEKIILSQR